MVKYHIGRDGTPRICRAKGKCTLGNSEEHFESAEEAQAYADKKNKLESKKEARNNKLEVSNSEEVDTRDITLDGDEDEEQEISLDGLLSKLNADEEEDIYNEIENSEYTIVSTEASKDYILALTQREHLLKRLEDNDLPEAMKNITPETKEELKETYRISSEMKGLLLKKKVSEKELSSLEQKVRAHLEHSKQRASKRMLKENLSQINKIRGITGSKENVSRNILEEQANRKTEIIESRNDVLDERVRLDKPKDSHLELNGYHKKGWFNPNEMYGKLKRGESQGEGNANGGAAIYGQGLYTTTSTKLAKEYGVVRTVTREEIPSNPLSFKTQMDFNHFQHTFAKEHGLDNTSLRHSIDVYIKKMGKQQLPKKYIKVIKNIYRGGNRYKLKALHI